MLGSILTSAMSMKLLMNWAQYGLGTLCFGEIFHDCGTNVVNKIINCTAHTHTQTSLHFANCNWSTTAKLEKCRLTIQIEWKYKETQTTSCYTSGVINIYATAEGKKTFCQFDQLLLKCIELLFFGVGHIQSSRQEFSQKLPAQSQRPAGSSSTPH